MAENFEHDAKIPHHFFIKYKCGDDWHYVLAGSVFSFRRDQISEATFEMIEAGFRRETFDATPVEDPEKEGLPVAHVFYAYQSAKNPFEER